MTVIAAITDGQTAWIGADSSGLDHGGLNWTCNDKVIALSAGGHRVLLAFAGSGRLKGNVRDFLAPTAPQGDLDVWARAVAREVTLIALEAQPPIVDPERGEVDGYGLLAAEGRIWRIAQDSAIPVHPACAIGSGGDIALGVLRTLDVTDSSFLPEDRVRLALDIACADQSDCATPLSIRHT